MPVESAKLTQTAVASLFSGVGALDLGLERAGLDVVSQCEIWEPARRVLAQHWPNVPVGGDVVEYNAPACSVLAAGFPCTDISHVGRRAGIGGAHSGLVNEVFRLAQAVSPEWIVLENVTNLLTLHRGAGMKHITEQLERLGYHWAYRTVDARFTGLPQRRLRVIILASRTETMANRLLAEDVTDHPVHHHDGVEVTPSGFYWTEGRNGVGLVRGSIPTLKGGSTIGLPSAPAVWYPENPVGQRFVLPSVSSGERLQGLPPGWVNAGVVPGERDLSWKLIGNAVPVPIGEWVGGRILTASGGEQTPSATPLDRDRRWPSAGFGSHAGAWSVPVSAWPSVAPLVPLEQLVDPLTSAPLSHRAVTGFLKRLDQSGLPVPDAFYRDLESHQVATRPKLTTSVKWDTDKATSARLGRQPQGSTKPELALRRALTALGLRYRLQYRALPDRKSRVDVAFVGARVAVDVRGCFWHMCPLHGTKPKANAERWAAKLARNVERDRQTVERLEDAGWLVVVMWEHDDPTEIAAKVESLVRDRTKRNASKSGSSRRAKRAL